MASGMNVIAHNLSAMFSDRQLGITTNSRAKSAEKLGSGYRINRAADDAAGLCISEKMRFKIRGLDQGTKNTQDGISFVQIGDGAMAEINEMLNRMTELSIKAANGTMSERDREDCDKEVQQLKEEINRISTTTQFNTIPVFNNPAPDKMARLSVTGVPDDLNVYNATYDGGKVTYGGIVFRGERISWDNITSENGNDMVYTDTDGVQRFHEGSYTYTNSAGQFFHLECEEGDQVPKFVRNVNFEADETKGISIDGEWFGWDKVKNDTGVAASDATAGDDFWTVDYHGAKVTFETLGVSDLKSMAEAINHLHDEKYVYDWHPEVNGSENVTAVSVGAGGNGFSNVHMTQSVADALNAGKSLVIHADDSGVWLEAGGSEVSNSKMTWSQMGLNDWSNGTDVNPAQLNYTWYENSGSGDKNNILHFDYTLSEVTSKDSVIAGLNGMNVTASGIRVGTGTSVTKSGSDSHIKSISGTVSLPSFAQEYAANRDYNKGTSTTANYTKGNTAVPTSVSYDPLTNRYSAAIDSVNFSASSASNAIGSRVFDYLHETADAKINAAINKTAYTPKTDKTGSFNVNMTSGAGNTISLRYTYDFTDAQDLIKADMEAVSTFPAGDYYVDTGSRYEKNLQLFTYTPGTTPDPDHPAAADLKAVSNTTDPATNLYYYDSANSQYSKFTERLYKMDPDPSLMLPSIPATWSYSDYVSGDYYSQLWYFDTNGDAQLLSPTADPPFPLFELKNPGGTPGTYSPASVTAGASTSDYYYYDTASGTYKSAAVSVVNLTDSSNNPINGTDISAMAEAYGDTANANLAAATRLNIKIDNYTTYNTSISERPNTAVRTTFESVVKKGERVEIFDGVNIQHSNTLNDRTWIPRFGMNSYAMGISNASCRTYDGALRTIDLAKEAGLYVATKRAIYGGMQNRYEHTVRINDNSSENLSYAESQIRDTNMNNEMVRFANLGIIQQAGQSMLAQTNQSRDYILSLLQ